MDPLRQQLARLRSEMCIRDRLYLLQPLLQVNGMNLYGYISLHGSSHSLFQDLSFYPLLN